MNLNGDKSVDKFYISYEKYFEIAKYLGRPEDVENIKKQEISGMYHHVGQDSWIDITKIRENKIEVCLENPTQKLKEDIEKITRNKK